jgi:pimeloyl-ACP methyl ester carboxylesterase
MYLTVDGARTYVADGHRPREAARPNLIFIHGAGLDHTYWLFYTRYYAHSTHNVLAVDLPAHGRSEGASLASVEAMAGWITALMDELALGQAVIVGHSMGALVALHLAGFASSRVSRVALLGFAYPMAVGEALLAAAKANDPAAFAMMTTWSHSYQSQLGGNPQAGVYIMNTMRRILEGCAPDVLYNDLNASHTYSAGHDAARAIEAPVTIISGASDRMAPPRAVTEIAELINGVRIETISNCGHIPMSEQPEQTHRALVAAIRG